MNSLIRGANMLRRQRLFENAAFYAEVEREVNW
jgi:hypothetical protein